MTRRTGIPKRLKGAARRLGFDLVARHYYSPIPNLEELPDATWTRRSDLRGVEFDPAAGLEFVERELARYIAEYAPPTAPGADPGRFYLDNGFYESLDAETLYAMVRRSGPRRVLELGSGMSSLVIADARARTELPPDSTHLIYDPHPRPSLLPALQEVAEFSSLSATEVPHEAVDALGAGDILFVDTTHTVKVGSEVNRIILDLLPRLAPGVLVHIHDIYLPWEYPREFMEERSFYWAEQYLLQAFLAFNESFEILFGTHALQREYPDRISKLLASAKPGIQPSAFWMRRSEPKDR